MLFIAIASFKTIALFKLQRCTEATSFSKKVVVFQALLQDTNSDNIES